MLQRFKDFIAKENLFLQTDKILIAVSGGMDSIVLCHLFHEAKLTFGIAHCNFDLRGKESDEDEKFVKGLTKKYNVAFYSKTFDTTSYSKENGISIQMAARDLRYTWFEKVRKEGGYNFIATAHHQNDVVETILINLIKGTGIAGLHGILAKKDNIIRPLLFATREEIEKYATEHKLKYREDSSNQSDKYLRNKIRNQVIPILKEINPKLEKTFMENIDRTKFAEALYKSKIESLKASIKFDYNGADAFYIFKLNKKGIKEFKTSILYELLSPYNFNQDVINDISKATDNPVTGKQFFSPTHRIFINRDHLMIDPIETLYDDKEFHFEKMDKDCRAYFLEADYFGMMIKERILENITDNLQTKNDYHLNEASILYPLTIRRWKAGDFFYPLGMNNKKKISDFLIDNKVPLNKKENTFVVLSGNDIICVLGHRIDNRYRITPFTKKVLTIHYTEK